MSVHRNVFDFQSYRAYLDFRLPTKGVSRGQRSQLAKAVRCQTAFVSQVIRGTANFSFEQAVLINRFLNHSEAEGDFFLLLVHLEKAGSKELEEYYLKQIRKIQEQRRLIAERIQVKTTLRPEDQMRYYSAWYYAAIHILVAVPGFQTARAISEHLKLAQSLVSDILEFLHSIGLVTQEGDEYRFGSQSIHLPQDSPMISKHHSNWRVRSMSAVDNRRSKDLFFSGPISLARKDAEILREKLLSFLEENRHFIADSKQDSLYCLNFDFFEI